MFQEMEIAPVVSLQSPPSTEVTGLDSPPVKLRGIFPRMRSCPWARAAPAFPGSLHVVLAMAQFLGMRKSLECSPVPSHRRPWEHPMEIVRWLNQCTEMRKLILTPLNKTWTAPSPETCSWCMKVT